MDGNNHDRLLYYVVNDAPQADPGLARALPCAAIPWPALRGWRHRDRYEFKLGGSSSRPRATAVSGCLNLWHSALRFFLRGFHLTLLQISAVGPVVPLVGFEPTSSIEGIDIA
jgi:hypothetical protein